ncbi:MAG TPA: hypothetical protein VGK46_04495, partial [Saprospiraceae bacterium]
NIFRKLLLVGTAALTIVSCGEDSANTSVITSFAKFPVTPESPIIDVAEFDNGDYVIDFATDDKQITDMHLEIAVGSSSTATEGEDFILNTHSVDLLALQGQDGFPVSITILDDGEIEEDEEIYLTFFTETPSGVDETEVLVGTIKGCTETVDDDLFVGDYTLTSTAGSDVVGGGAPIFNDQTVTLEVAPGGKRTFEAVYYEVFDLGNAALEWTLVFDDCNGSGFVFRTDETNLGCGPANIKLIPVAPFGTTDASDDSEFTVVLTEFEADPSAGCGADGSLPVTLTFTKVP